jgi:O-succinylbenzoic acid--CoA ligase
MDPYPYDSISLNGKEVFIQDIITNRVPAGNEFESGIISFIRDWLSDKNDFVQQTSGSTGTPKPVTISRTHMVASARLTAEALGLQRGDHALVCLSPSFIAGKMMLVRSFVIGMKITATTPSSNPFAVLPLSQPIDFVALVPSQLYDILRSASATVFEDIKTAIIGGAALDSESRGMLQPFRCGFYATYGMTETVSHIALMPLNGTSAANYFTTLPGIAVEADERGCLVIKWSKLPGQVVTTNDVAEIMDATRFRLVGRWDNIVNSGGYKILPEELESRIAEILEPLNLNITYFLGGIPDPKFDHKLVLIIEQLLDDRTITQIRDVLQKQLSGFQLPREIRTGITFVRTGSGKINRPETLRLIR